MYIHTAFANKSIPRPHRSKYLLPREELPGMLSEKVEDKMLPFGQSIRSVPIAHSILSASTKHCPHPCQYRVEREGLGDIIIGTYPKSLQLVVVGIAGGKENDGCIVAGFAKVACHLKPRHPVHHHIQENQVVMEHRKRLFGARRRLHLESFGFQIKPKYLPKILFIVYNQNSIHIKITPQNKKYCRMDYF